jgi:hypothetical protein
MVQVMPSQVDIDDEAFVRTRQKRCKVGEAEAEEQALAVSRFDRAIKRAAADECDRRISAVFKVAGEAAGEAAEMSPAQAAGPEREPCDHPMLICCRGFRLHWDKSYVPHCGGCDQLVFVSHLSFCPDVCGCDDYTEVHGSDNENCQYCQFGACE